MKSIGSKLLAVASLTAALLISSATQAQNISPDARQEAKLADPISHARRVEARALKTSFVELEAFGQMARTRPDPEALSRLQHVTRIIINQGDFEGAERWNETLRLSAQKQKNARYLAVAQVNTMQIRHLRDHDVSVAEMEALAQAQTDWLPKVFAQTALARRLFDEGRIGDALRLMVGTISLIPDDQTTEASVAAAAWDVVAIAHVMVDDVPGHLKAIDRAETYMAASDYPRPDYESLYNLTQSLSYLGRHDEAKTLAETYERLAARTNTPTSRGYAGNICAFAAASREAWPDVLQCLAPFGSDLDVPEVVKNSMLPFRATAYARLGDLPMAQRDVDDIHTRITQKLMSAGSGVKRAEAELMIAGGDFTHGIPALRTYHLARFQRASKSAAAAMEQVVGNMDDQLRVANEQSRLKNDVINSHRMLVGVLLVLGSILVAAVFMLAKQRQLYRQQAITDTLTGLPNRRYTEARVNEIIGLATSRGGSAIVTLIDLDHFKSCNDTYGHDAGDDALKTFATLVKDTIRPGDVFGRWGGEEFLLAIPNAGLDEAKALLQRIKDKADATPVAMAPDYKLHFSGGAVDVPRSARSLDEVLLVSDRRLYAAKKAGRNRVTFSDSEQFSS